MDSTSGSTLTRILFMVVQAGLLLGRNYLTAGNVVFGGWTAPTALALYWLETLVGALLTIVRIAVHRQLTRKKGHYRGQMGATITTKRGEARPAGATYLAEFGTVSVVFCVAHGIFLAAVLLIIVKEQPNRAQLIEGAKWMLALQAAGFVIDLVMLREWSFAELKRTADQTIGRIGLIHFAILGGMVVAAVSSRPRAFFAVFGGLKTLSELASLLPFRNEAPVEAPRWFVYLARKLGSGKHWKTGQDVETWWREDTLAQRRRAEENEERVAPTA